MPRISRRTVPATQRSHFLAASRKERLLFSSESVTGGHPDKVADQISDGVLDAVLREDKKGRVACETAVKNNLVLVFGEITTSASYDVHSIVRDTIHRIGYNHAALGFDSKTCTILTQIDRQSPDIAQGVNQSNAHREQGAGDQGMMFGFACRETPELMPMPIAFAHRLTRRLTEAREEGDLKWLRPDGKSQVTIEYRNGKPARIDQVVVSAQHDPSVFEKDLRAGIMAEVIRAVLPPELLDRKTVYHINPTGRFVTGGPVGDGGLTGRKIIVDTYGGMGRHGGGAFSGKDPSKVDRSAAYAARWIAKNIVAAGLADKAEVQVAYAIGYPQPVSLAVFSEGAVVRSGALEAAVRKVFDLRPRLIIEELDLLRPIYSLTASGGHFGRTEPEFTWERTDRVAALRKALRLPT